MCACEAPLPPPLAGMAKANTNCWLPRHRAGMLQLPSLAELESLSRPRQTILPITVKVKITALV